jgi:hypothetical protein
VNFVAKLSLVLKFVIDEQNSYFVSSLTRLWSGGFQLPHESPYHSFIEALGPGQKVSRQVLGLPCLGEVKMSIFLQNEKLTIEVSSARNLKQKTGYKFLPGN